MASNHVSSSQNRRFKILTVNFRLCISRSVLKWQQMGYLKRKLPKYTTARKFFALEMQKMGLEIYCIVTIMIFFLILAECLIKINHLNFQKKFQNKLFLKFQKSNNKKMFNRFVQKLNCLRF
jgi:hypothetical protein